MKFTGNIFNFYAAIFGLFFSTVSFADFEFQGYMRAPVGGNSRGGKQIQLINPGSQANEFRLGNETGYGEAFLIHHFMKPADKRSPFFDATLTFAYGPNMSSQYADTTTNGDYLSVIEAYAKGGNLDGVMMSFWAGKRFYRDADVHMNDFFYFANMSGNGGGVEDIELSSGTLAVAILQYTDDRSLTQSSIGHPTKHALDLRWRSLELGPSDHLHLWIAQAYTAPGRAKLAGSAADVDFQASSGTAVGARWRRSYTGGFNDFALIYGNGVMESLTLDSTAFAVNDTIKKQSRFRAVENYTMDFDDKWSLQTALMHEIVDSGAATNSKSKWTSVGVRPMYAFSEHFRLQAQLGHSIVQSESEVDAAGNSHGARSLTRITISPEVAFTKGYFARPVVRFYVSHTAWNDANKNISNASSLLGNLNSKGIIALNDQNAETQAGFQSEVWF